MRRADSSGASLGLESLAPSWFVRLSMLPSGQFVLGVGFFLALVMALKYWLVQPGGVSTALTTPIPLNAVYAILIRVIVNPIVETLIFVCLPCEYLLQTDWGRQLLSRYWWARGLPCVWGSMAFGVFHFETKPPLFLLFTAVVGAVYLLVYLHARRVSPWAALRVTTYVHALHNLVFAVLMVTPYLS